MSTLQEVVCAAVRVTVSRRACVRHCTLCGGIGHNRRNCRASSALRLAWSLTRAAKIQAEHHGRSLRHHDPRRTDPRAEANTCATNERVHLACSCGPDVAEWIERGCALHEAALYDRGVAHALVDAITGGRG